MVIIHQIQDTMANVLLITTADLKRFSALSGNIDDDKLIQFVKIAQDIHIQNYLGTDLYVRLKEGVQNSDLTSNETALINNYVKDMLIHWSLVEVLGHVAYTISNNGVFKRFNENSETVTKDELDSLIQRHRTIAQSYTRRFVAYMCENSVLFPEYDSNEAEDVYPSQETDFYGWVL